MPSPKLSKSQSAKQKKATEDFHNNPNKPTSANSIRVPRSLANIDSKLSAMVDKALDIMDRVIKGENVPKGQVDAAKWVIPQARDMKKVILDNKMQKLKLQIEELKVKPAEQIVAPPTITNVTNNVVDLHSHLTSYDQDWDEKDQFSYEDDEEVIDDSESESQVNT